MAQGVMIFAEASEGELASIAKEMLGVGRTLADALGEPLQAAVLGSGPGCRWPSTWPPARTC